jgi:hypothetical protein
MFTNPQQNSEDSGLLHGDLAPVEGAPELDLSLQLPEVPLSARDAEVLSRIDVNHLIQEVRVRLVNDVDQLLAQNTEVSIEKATELLSSITALSVEGESGIFKPATDLTRRAHHGKAELTECELIGGRINGRLQLFDRALPVLNGQVLETVEGHSIRNCSDVQNVDFKLNAIVALEDGRLLPIKDGKLITEINGQSFSKVKFFRNIDGKINGCFQVNGNYVPVVNGLPIPEIGGRTILDCADFEVIDGKLNGRVRLSSKDYSYLPVLEGKLVEEIAEEKILHAENVKNINGRLNCTVRLENYHYHDMFPVQNGYLKPKK